MTNAAFRLPRGSHKNKGKSFLMLRRVRGAGQLNFSTVISGLADEYGDETELKYDDKHLSQLRNIPSLGTDGGDILSKKREITKIN